jgi:glycine/serine hydroxymethyltransferase
MTVRGIKIYLVAPGLVAGAVAQDAVPDTGVVALLAHATLVLPNGNLIAVL